MQNLSQILSLSFSVFSKSPKELNLPISCHYATVSKYMKSSIDMFGLSLSIYSDKAGSFLLLVLSPCMEHLHYRNRLAR